MPVMIKTLNCQVLGRTRSSQCLVGVADACSRRAWLCPLPVAGITDRLFLPLDLVLYCEAFLTTYRTFITPEELIKKLQYRYPFWAPTLAPHLSRHRACGNQEREGPSCPLSPHAGGHVAMVGSSDGAAQPCSAES